MDAACVLEKNEGDENHAYFRENWGIKGERKTKSTYLHCLPLIFSKIFSLATLYFHAPIRGRGTYTAGMVKSVSLLKVGRKSVDFPSCTFDDLITQNLN